MKGEACAGTGEEGHLNYIHTCARRERREETKREGRKKKERLSQADRRFRNYILKNW